MFLNISYTPGLTGYNVDLRVQSQKNIAGMDDLYSWWKMMEQIVDTVIKFSKCVQSKIIFRSELIKRVLSNRQNGSCEICYDFVTILSVKCMYLIVCNQVFHKKLYFCSVPSVRNFV